MLISLEVQEIPVKTLFPILEAIKLNVESKFLLLHMQRFLIELAYQGKNYFGWQRQINQISVQERIELALTRLNKNESVTVFGCGRTDTGVHAKHYVLHVDLNESFETEILKHKLNRMLPADIVIFDVRKVHSSFHARFDAVSRTYRYFLGQEKDPFSADHCFYFPSKLNVEAMNEAAQFLLGKQDFTSLSKVHTDVKTNICTVSSATWVQTSDTNLYFEIQADRFLRNMVRASVGTLLDVGTGKLEATEIPLILEKKDRGAASLSVPAHGLFLWNVAYDFDNIETERVF